ncbi:non-ribosomal peptide synthetase [Anaerocolumna xylanovorans]|uniref:Pyochelin synthetase n=1 Tax=Anaerocolumna xylanovorans DSM 12503 TaxID=1121345 RepID=A0A1M7YID9_9FIRM|nr:non-ribosomal peptide synthetase [Anaerocolumna xylanovorans]SHO52356.1 pyochelin synthetase [Anaerocolumna xylanovorans DSM 12503]
MKKLPLSNIQRAYFMGRDDLLELNGVSTHIYYECKTKLDSKKFETAFNKVIKSQPMLRAVFDNKGYQIILDEVPEYHIEVEDLRKNSIKEIDGLMKMHREQMSHKVFDAAKWPLFQITFKRVTDEESIMTVGFDLLIADGKSLVDMFGMVMDQYDKETVILPQMEKDFEDYIILKEEEKKSARYRNSREYWLSRIEDIADAPHVIEGNNLNVKNVRFERFEHFIDADNWNRIKSKLNQQKITPTIGTLSAYCAVMGYWSNQKKFTINTPVSSMFRRKKEASLIIGDFTEAMLIQAEKYELNKNFSDYMKEVEHSFRASYKHNTFDGIEVMNAIRNRKAEKVIMPVVFTSMLFKEDSFSNMERVGDITYGISQTPQVYLDCQLMERRGSLSITWDYVEALFDKEKLNYMFKQFVDIILKLQEDEIDLEDILTIPKKQKIELEKYNSTEVERPAMNLGCLFERSFHKYSNLMAVKDDEKELTYAQLDQWSGAIAAFLNEKGIHTNDRVGILCHRCVETVVNMLGVMKSGAAYVPIDPNYPEDRRNFIYSNSSCILLLDREMAISCKNGRTAKASFAAPEDVAYVIYTSGSTGTPKGVIISNDAVCNTVLNINSRFSIDSEDRLLGLASFGFDLSVYDVLGALSSGAKLIISENPQNIKVIRRNLAENNITFWNSVPAIMELFVDSVEEDYVNRNLRLALLSGDWIPINLIDKVRKHFPSARIVSLGGATEGSIWSIYYDIDCCVDGMRSIPYGYPMENQKMYILDEAMKQLPYEVEGEIYIGGRGVACGYENDKERTDDTFIKHPEFGCLYKTGDYGRMISKGYMEFCGRKDNQVKIRGYRIELAEIDKAISDIDGIKCAVTDVYNNGTGGKSLVTYLVTEDEREGGSRITGEIDRIAREECSRLDSVYDFRYIEEINASLEEACTASMIKTLSDLHAWDDVSGSTNVRKIMKDNNIPEKFEKLLTEWMNELTEDGYFEKAADQYQLIKEIADNAEQLWNAEVFQGAAGAVDILNKFIKESCDNHLKLLSGEVNALSLFFPKGETYIAESMYQNNPVSKYINTVTQRTLLHYVSGFDQKRKIKILEIGAGIGGTTAEIFEELGNYNVEYTFTDVTDLFLTNARKLYGGFDYIKYSMLDINSDFQIQGYEYGYYDIVIAANVLHDAVNLDKTIGYISNILDKEGLLFLVEATRNLRSQMSSVGFIEGFSSYEDERKKTNKPLLDKEGWNRVLSANGMKNVRAYPVSEKIEDSIWQSLIISQNGYGRINVRPDFIRNTIAGKLPEHMIPVRYLRINEIPLSNNGKVNKKLLLKIDDNKIYHIHEQPKNDMEKMLVEIWREVLNKNEIGVKDDFFELGGDSLKAISIIAKTENQGYELKIADLYNNRTIEKIENVIIKVSNSDRYETEDFENEILLESDEMEMILQAQNK